MLSKLVHFVLENMASDGVSAEQASKIMSFAQKNSEALYVKEVLSDIEDKETVNSSLFPFRIITKARIIFIGIILPIYYCFTLIALLPAFVIGLFAGRTYQNNIDRDSWNILFQHWGKYPNSFVIKALELLYFNKESIDKPSFEIGVYRGDTSKAVFNNKYLQVGMEFIPSYLLSCAGQQKQVHEHLICGDIYDIPFADNTFRSIFMVHSMDDIQRGAVKAVKEMSRVIEPGGKLVFSSYSGYFGEQNILLRILQELGLKRLKKKMFELIYIGTHNIYDESKWRDILLRNGLILEKYVHFIPMWVAWLIDIPFRLEGYLMNLFSFHDAFKPFHSPNKIRQIYKYLLMKVLDGIWSTSFDANGREKPGMNIFAIARKDSKDTSQSIKIIEDDFNFMEKIRCPACMNKIRSNTDDFDTKIGPFLTCRQCNKKYPLVGSIPILLKDFSKTKT